MIEVALITCFVQVSVNVLICLKNIKLSASQCNIISIIHSITRSDGTVHASKRNIFDI